MRRTVVALLALIVLAPLAASVTVAPPPLRAATLDPALAAAIAAGASTLPVIVRFGSVEDVLAYAPHLDGRAALPLRNLPGAAFVASAQEIRALALRDGVAYVELDAPMPVHLPTATTATRAASVWGGASHIRDGVGAVIDGSGIGVAVIDTGADAGNPAIAANVVQNVKVVGPRQLARDFASIFLDEPVADELPEFFVPLTDTDVGGGHGTHVTGIVVARGTQGRVGAAPGASAYVFGTGAGLTLVTSSSAAAWDWIIAHHDDVSPAIRVVSNSYGNVGAWNPQSAISVLSTRAIGEGLVVVWAAGNGDTLNDGGTGADDRTTTHSKNPTPGSISVANYDDANSGTRDGALSSTSSRGIATNASTWPDVSAPGTDILSARAATDPLFALGLPFVEPDGNQFGNAIDQLQAEIRFHLGGATSPTATLELIIFTHPAVVYNAHEARFVAGRGGTALVGADAAATQNLRYYAPAPFAIGPVAPGASSAASVGAGDRIELTKLGGTSEASALLVVAPDGSAAEVIARLPCDEGCSTSIDLGALFPGAPSDGTWTLSVGRTARPERMVDATQVGWTSNTGTSMAAPHVAGVVALMLQADPTLTPAQVERILEATAHAFAAGAPYAADPTHPDGATSLDKGHGLVDALAAVIEAQG